MYVYLLRGILVFFQYNSEMKFPISKAKNLIVYMQGEF